MTNKSKIKLAISSVILLLPMIFGLVQWDSLSESMVIHWGIGGESNGMGPTWLAVIVLPLIFLVIHWICIGFTLWDNKRKGQSEKVLNLVFWILPLLSLVIFAFMYALAFGYEFDPSTVAFPLFGVLFLVIGNYLPKCKQNRTVGIKIKWTLANEENWNKTHRIGGMVSVIVGVLCFPAAFLPMSVLPFVLIPLVGAVVGIPSVYSYWFYKKQLREGTATKEDYEKGIGKISKASRIVALIMIPLVLGACAVLLFTGNVKIHCSQTSVIIEATYWEDMTVDYAAVDSIEYREEGVDGSRINGFGSFRLSLGIFRNEEFGNYICYTYNQCTPCIVLRVGEKILVLNLNGEEQTKALYEEILLCIGK